MDIKSKIFQALGEASLCWFEHPQGVFNSDRLNYIGNELSELIINRTKNIEKLMKFCSELNLVFTYPYYFNWSTVNHIDNSEETDILDVRNCVLRFGYYNNGNAPIEKIIWTGSVEDTLSLLPFAELFNETKKKNIKNDENIVIRSFDDIVTYKEEIIQKLIKL